MLSLVFTPIALMIGLCLYVRSPSRDYIAFAYWLWMLTPLYRRLADWQTAFQPISMIMLAPVLVSSLTMLTFVRKTRFPMPGITHCFLILIAVCCYGAVLGILQGAISATIFGLLNWLVPLTMAMHVLAFWRDAEAMARTLFRTLAWGGLVMGVYGVLQYFSPPPWDAYWMIASKMASIGRPEPQQVRLFSTMNSPVPLAVFMAACLLVLLSDSARNIRWIAAAPALAVFLLSLVRSSWGGLVVSILIMVIFSRTNVRIRYILIAVASTLVAVPLLTIGPIADSIQSRVATMYNLDSDDSFQTRAAIYAEMSGDLLGYLVGFGMGSTGISTRLANSDGALGETANFDSGLLNLLFVFGWAGFVFILTFFVLIWRMLRHCNVNDYSRIATAVFIGTCAQLLFANMFSGVLGMLVFPMAAIAVVQYAQARSFGWTGAAASRF